MLFTAVTLFCNHCIMCKISDILIWWPTLVSVGLKERDNID